MSHHHLPTCKKTMCIAALPQRGIYTVHVGCVSGLWWFSCPLVEVSPAQSFYYLWGEKNKRRCFTVCLNSNYDFLVYFPFNFAQCPLSEPIRIFIHRNWVCYLSCGFKGVLLSGGLMPDSDQSTLLKHLIFSFIQNWHWRRSSDSPCASAFTPL